MRQRRIDFVDFWFLSLRGHSEICETWNHHMLEWPGRCLITGINPITNGTALHQNDRVMAILAHWRRSQAKNVLGFGLSQHLLKTERGEMMAFVHDDLAISGHQIVHHMFAAEALYYRHVDEAGRFFATAANLPNRFNRKVQKNRQSLAP